MTCRDYVLRTLASVPVNRYVLVLGCEAGDYTAPLLRLGFPVHACHVDPEAITDTRTAIAPLMEDPAEATECVQRCTLALDGYPDSVFDWVVAPRLDRVYPSSEVDTAFDAVQRIVKPGGWAVLGYAPEPVPAGGEDGAMGWPVTPEALIGRCQQHSLVEAGSPETDTQYDDTQAHLYGLFRRARPAT